MDLRTQTALIAAVLCLALSASVLLRARKRRVHWLFGGFGFALGLWYVSTFLTGLLGGGRWAQLNLASATLVPLAAVQFFRAFMAEDNRRMTLLNRVSIVSALVILVAVGVLGDHVVVGTGIFLYVVFSMFAALAMLYAHGRAASSRFEGAKLKYLALVGGLAAVFTLVDYLPLVGLDIPPVGTVLILIFLYVLSQSILRYRLLDLYELAGRLAVLTALSFSLASVLWLLAYFAGGRFFLHAVVAAGVVLLLLDPLSTKVEEKISQFFFRERYDFERAMIDLRRRVAHTLELDHLAHTLLSGLEGSRRITHASLYLLDDELYGYNLVSHVGPDPAARVEMAPARPLLDRLRRDGSIVLEQVERELGERRETADDREAETLYEIVQTMEALCSSVCVAIQTDHGDVYGLLNARDERMRDAFSPEEVQLLAGVAAQAAISLENSRLYQRLKERDRLAALGEMAAGLAHEIRNPLGAIKASAQYLTDPRGDDDAEGAEFLDIIVEEVDRLNRVVSSFLDYARPASVEAEPTDVNAAVQRTMQILAPEVSEANVTTTLELATDLPLVRIDVEQLRQVLINLVKNAVQAMEAGGALRLETSPRERAELGGLVRRWVEMRVTDTGPGIPKRVLQNLFVPFVTTKDRGTGLGLAISQRIVDSVGGTIDVRSHSGVGTTFVVRLPVAEEIGTPMPAQVPSVDVASSNGSSDPKPSSSSPPGEGDTAGSAGAGDTASGVTTSR